jgi:hypothetical protein
MTSDKQNDYSASSEEVQDKSSSRRKFLRRSGVIVAALGAYGVPAAAASSTTTHVAPTSSVDQAKPYSIDLDVVDHVDGYLVVRPSLRANLNGIVESVSNMRMSDGLSIQITQGEAKVSEDPYTGNILIAPIGLTPIKARGVLRPMLSHGNGVLTASPVLGGAVLVGAETHIGFSAVNIPRQQQSVAIAGGGSCVSSTSLSNTTNVPQQLITRLQSKGLSLDQIKEMAKNYNFKLRVRASIASNVIPHSKQTREIIWQHGLYFAEDPVLGRMRLHYNPDPGYRSRTVMNTNAATPNTRNFFPASGVTQLYFVLEFLDLGYRAFNKEPMNLHFQDTAWPPFATPLNIEKPVQFYNLDNPDEVILTVHENKMQLYDYASIEIENLHYEVDTRGLLRTRWRITNQATTPINGQWFVIGDFVHSKDLPDQGLHQFGAAGSGQDTLELDYVGRLKKSSLTQMITMNLVSYDDPVVVGTNRISFRYPM